MNFEQKPRAALRRDDVAMHVIRQRRRIKAWDRAVDEEHAIFDSEIAPQVEAPDLASYREKWTCARAEKALIEQGIVPPHFVSLATCERCGEMPAERPSVYPLERCPWCEWTATHGNDHAVSQKEIEI